MTNTIQQLKEEMIEEFSHKWFKMERDGGFMSDYPECPNDNSRDSEKVEKWVSTALDKVIKATADAMVEEVETLSHYYRSKFSSDMSRNETYEERNAQMLLKEDVISIITRIAEEKALRDEITQ